ncbi:PQ-loop-domain-containing protein [Ascodesmis nigricans]|uniref:PQ-loop-domain-containing protein n=1 Tax=Ascodesmis nigricans TaxID=341454 RepID=A0A4S2MTU3_9PEZI|nr:PQ-loop-domain-containing protein [Ascodesmis nigricans]
MSSPAPKIVSPDLPAASEHAFAHAVSRLIGWCYVAAWSVSFYPQFIINFRRKAVTGLSPDFFTLNVLGFACYTVSSATLLFSQTVRDQYSVRHPNSPEPTVRWNDLAFAAHALIISTLTWSQFFAWGYERHRSQRLSTPVTLLIFSIFGAIVLSAGFVDPTGGHRWQWLDVIYTLQYSKLLISLTKYIPQALLNHRLQSTVGWSIENILLDLTGGVLSLAQLLVDASLQADWSGIIGNPVKFWLSQIAIIFDLVFIWQHYVLYRNTTKKVEEEEAESRVESERRGLLAGEEREI